MLSMSQDEFGRAVRVSGRTIQQIENGLLKMSPALAEEIEDVFGLDREQLIAGDDPLKPRFAKPLLAEEFELFSREGYETYSRGPEKIARKDIDSALELFGAVLELGADAANDIHRARSFVLGLKNRIETYFQEFGIDEPARKILEAYKISFFPDLPPVEELFFLNEKELKEYLKARDLIRPQRYSGIPEKPSLRFRPRPKGPPPRLAEAYRKITATPPTFRPRSKEASPQSSPKGRSPRKLAPPIPPHDRDSAARKPSGSRRGQAPG
jgi:DNA-binding XRE family transcriptional regulator